MSVHTLTRESHKDPEKFRIRYKDAKLILDEKQDAPYEVNYELPVIETTNKITIIGAGFGGISAALSTLKKLKTDDFIIFEKHADFGGTWWANTYPGCASDIPALWYSLHDELVDNWSDLRPPQYEMEEYIQLIVNKYGLRSRSRFKTAIIKAEFSDTQQQWVIDAVDVESGQRIKHTTPIIVNCTGGLVVPNKFAPKGIEKFKGNYLHSGIWDWSVDMEGKKIVVVGNGCSAAQVIPALLDYKPEKITQVVRSKHYVFPPHPPRLYKLYLLLARWTFGLTFVRLLTATFAELRFPMYTGKGFLASLMRFVNTRLSHRYMKSRIPKKYHDMLIPTYKIGCKRLIFDYHYAPSLNDDRIEVTDQEIVEVKEHSVILKSGEELETDVIIACTGYNLEKSFGSYEIVGKNGFNLKDLWDQEGTSAYETILAKQCPNFFIIGGPNSATGHSSVVMAIENGCTYFVTLASKILDGTYKSITVKDERYDEWFKTIQEKLKKSVFGTSYGGCVSWYSTAKANSTAYPYSQITYWYRMTHPKWEDLDTVKSG